LLPLLGLPFVVKAVEVDEAPWPGEPPTELVLRVSRAKAYAGSSTRPDELVIAADTVVAHDGEVLGKPRDAEEAIQMLQRLRSRPHLVYSGVSVWHPSRRRLESELAETLVWMRNYSDEEIARYVESGDPLDKAGAYAIQHPTFDPVARLEGCRLNVVGLPLCHLGRALGLFGVQVPSSVPGACQAFTQRACPISAEGLPRGGSQGGGTGVR